MAKGAFSPDVLDEAEFLAGLQDAPELGQDLPLVSDRAKDKTGDHGVERFVGEWQVLGRDREQFDRIADLT